MLSLHIAGVCLLVGLRLFFTGSQYTVHVIGMWMTVVSLLYAFAVVGGVVPLESVPRGFGHFAWGCTLGLALVGASYSGLFEFPRTTRLRWSLIAGSCLLLVAYVVVGIPMIR